MIHVVKRRSISKARYRSPLRDEQTRQTRARILDGLLETMKGGLAQVSVPAVAKAARVSVPTIYRHFPTKRALFDAVAAHVGLRTGLSTPPPAADLPAFSHWVRETFARLDAMDPALAAAMGGALGGQIRRQSLMPRRLKLFDQALAPALQALKPREREFLRRIAVLLTSSGALRTLKSYLQLSADEAADTVVWALERLTAAPQNSKGRRWDRPHASKDLARTSDTR
jgi:AcrR family transcriptional regulator